jgi:hypothetical protein
METRTRPGGFEELGGIWVKIAKKKPKQAGY